MALLENGQRIELPASQAVLRSLMTAAIKGNRLAQKYALEHVAKLEAQYLNFKVERYKQLEALKRDGEQKLAEHVRQDLPPPDLLPHPDDIVLNPATLDAHVAGPETPAEVYLYEHTVRLRDHLLLRSAHVYEGRKRSETHEDSGSVCVFLFFAQWLDQLLPHRFRWEKNGDVSLSVEYSSLTRRESERRIAAELARLKATRSPLTLITSEAERGIEKIVRRFVVKRERRSDPTS